MEKIQAGSEAYYRSLYSLAQEGAKVYHRAGLAEHWRGRLEFFSSQLHIAAQNEVALKTLNAPVPTALMESIHALTEIVAACKEQYELYA